MLMDDLLWLGLEWDEGPRVGGPNGPYWQSQRGDFYEKALQELCQRGLVYPCTCTRADIMATQAPHESWESQYDAADNLACYTEYTWDETGRVQTKKHYSADGTFQNDYNVYTYDEYGNKIMNECYRDGEVHLITYYVYQQLLTA